MTRGINYERAIEGTHNPESQQAEKTATIAAPASYPVYLVHAPLAGVVAALQDHEAQDIKNRRRADQAAPVARQRHD